MRWRASRVTSTRSSASVQREYKRAVSEIIEKVKKAFDENDITIPFPIRTMDFGIKGGEKLSDVLEKSGDKKNGS